jgi:hypothetical protein
MAVRAAASQSFWGQEVIGTFYHRMIEFPYRPHQSFRFPLQPRNAQP